MLGRERFAHIGFAVEQALKHWTFALVRDGERQVPAHRNCADQLGCRTVHLEVRDHQNLWQIGIRVGERFEHVVDAFGCAFRVDQGCSEGCKMVGPDTHD